MADDQPEGGSAETGVATGTGVVAETPETGGRRGKTTWRFSKYSAMSLITVPVGYTVLLIAVDLFPNVNAGLLNLAVGTVLTPPSFLLYRFVVWNGGGRRSVWAELFSFWQTVMIGAIASSVLIAAVDVIFNASGPLIILAGLVGQGVIFLGRFLWLDKVTFSPPALAAESRAPGD